MKTRILSILCLALALTAFGCDKKQAEEPAQDEANAEAPAEEAAEEAEAPAEEKAEGDKIEADELKKVEVAKAGQKFDPAVQAEQLPAGAWYCDMGTVHWAAMEKPEGGKCPECNMALKQLDPGKLAEQKANAVEAKEDHGHEHAEGHDHGHAH